MLFIAWCTRKNLKLGELCGVDEDIGLDCATGPNPPLPLPGLEPRICTRWDMHRYAREAYNLGVRFIGGCCGFEAYHIRAVAEELAKERGKLPAGSEKHDQWGGGLRMHTKPWVRARWVWVECRRESCKCYW